MVDTSEEPKYKRGYDPAEKPKDGKRDWSQVVALRKVVGGDDDEGTVLGVTEPGTPDA